MDIRLQTKFILCCLISSIILIIINLLGLNSDYIYKLYINNQEVECYGEIEELSMQCNEIKSNIKDILIDKENNYKDKTINICKTRKKLLFDSLDIGINENENDASYYTQIDLLRLCKKRYGEEFVEYLKANYKPVDILFDLAQKSSIVLLGGGGFAGPEWSIRISLANLYDEAYSEIGVVLKRILDSYADDWKKLQG